MPISLRLRLHLILVITILTSCALQPHTGTRTHSLRTSQQPGEAAELKAVQAYSDSESYSSSDCLRCHSQYNENHHPVNFTVTSSSNFPFPLYEGRVRCLTCHIGNHEEPGNMLRGGPYSDRREICFKCHYKESYSEIDPHFMLNEDGEIRNEYGQPICLLCHAKTPDPVVDRADDVLFRADIAFLCWRCHAPMVNPIFNQHFLQSLL